MSLVAVAENDSGLHMGAFPSLVLNRTHPHELRMRLIRVMHRLCGIRFGDVAPVYGQGWH